MSTVIWVSPVVYAKLQELGWDMRYYRVAEQLPKAPVTIEHDPKERRP